MRAYSMDLCERVLHDSDAGSAPCSAAAVAGKYRVSASWVRRLFHVRMKRSATPLPSTKRGTLNPEERDLLLDIVKSPRASSATGGTSGARAPAAHARGVDPPPW